MGSIQATAKKETKNLSALETTRKEIQEEIDAAEEELERLREDRGEVQKELDDRTVVLDEIKKGLARVIKAVEKVVRDVGAMVSHYRCYLDAC